MVQLCRKVHLYLGLLLAPFILVYGISAILFNHPMDFTIGTDQEVASYDYLLPNPKDVAASFNLGNVKEAYYQKFFFFKEDGARRVLLFQNFGKFKELVKFDKEEKNVQKEQSLPIEIDPLLIHFQGIKKDSVKVERFPELYIQTDKGSFVYDAQKKNLTSIESFSFIHLLKERNLSSYLKNLHKTHKIFGPWHYKIWAIFVDIIALSMIFWVLSGLVMWYSVKKQHNLGMKLLGLGGIIFMLALFGSLYTIVQR